MDVIEALQRGIHHGVGKVNIYTDLRLPATSAIRKVLVVSPGEFDPRKYLKPAMDSMKAQAMLKDEAFGTAAMRRPCAAAR